MKSKVGNLIKFLIATLVLVVLFSFAMFQGDEVSWFLFYSFIPVYLYLIGMLVYSLKRWKITRKISSTSFFAGDTITIDLWIEKPNWFPLFSCVVEEVVPESLHKRNLGNKKYENFTEQEFVFRRMKRIVFPWFKKKFHFTYEIAELPRGKHHLSTVRILVTDIFGFIQKRREFPLYSEFTVMPKEKAVSFQEGKLDEGIGLGEKMSRSSQSQIVSGSRPYEPGDRLSIIDWKQTAKQQELMTKEFEEENNRERIFLFNQTIDKQTTETTFEVAIEISLYVLRRLVQSGIVTFVSVGEESTRIQLDKRNQFPQVLHHFMHVEPVKTSRFEYVQQCILSTENLSAMDLIFLTTRLNHELSDVLQHAKRKGEQITVIFIQAMSLRTKEEEKLIHTLQSSDIRVIHIDERTFTQTRAVGVKRS